VFCFELERNNKFFIVLRTFSESRFSVTATTLVTDDPIVPVPTGIVCLTACYSFSPFFFEASPFFFEAKGVRSVSELLSYVAAFNSASLTPCFSTHRFAGQQDERYVYCRHGLAELTLKGFWFDAGFQRRTEF
jgi:hypothetical protein